MATMQAQPVLNQFDDDFVRHEAAASKHFSGLLPQRCSEISFTAQNSARRSDRNAKLARNHFRLCAFARTGWAKKNKPPFHSSSLLAVKKNGDPGNHQHGDTHI